MSRSLDFMDWLWCITKCRQNCVFRSSCKGWSATPHRSALLPRGQFNSDNSSSLQSYFSPQFIMVANCFGLHVCLLFYLYKILS